MTKENIDVFEKTQTQLEGLYSEISMLSKKAQNDALNKFKLSFVNQILLKANEILDKKYRPFSGFELFDENDMPTNSDAAMILAQYLSCFKKLRSDNIDQDYGNWYWIIDGERSDIKTMVPKKINRK